MKVLLHVSDNLISVAARALLAAEQDLTVIDRSAAPTAVGMDGAAGLPDVAVCTARDIRAVELSMAAARARPPIVALLQQPSYELVSCALRSGAAGLHCISCHLLDLPTAVRAIGCGAEAWFAPCIAASIAAHLSGRVVPMGDHRLTPREAAILKLMANGAANAEIASELRVHIRTVKHHTSSIFRKLGARNRSEAVALAYRLGLVA